MQLRYIINQEKVIGTAAHMQVDYKLHYNSYYPKKGVVLNIVYFPKDKTHTQHVVFKMKGDRARYKYFYCKLKDFIIYVREEWIIPY